MVCFPRDSYLCPVWGWDPGAVRLRCRARTPASRPPPFVSSARPPSGGEGGLSGKERDRGRDGCGRGAGDTVNRDRPQGVRQRWLPLSL